MNEEVIRRANSIILCDVIQTKMVQELAKDYINNVYLLLTSINDGVFSTT